MNQVRVLPRESIQVVQFNRIDLLLCGNVDHVAKFTARTLVFLFVHVRYLLW